MDTIHSGQSTIINSKFQDIAKILPDECADLVFADWPFNGGIVSPRIKRLMSDGIKQAYRLLDKNGTLLSINFIEPNFYVWKEAEYWGLHLADSITVLRHPIKKVKYRLGYETLSILVFTKGPLENRTLKTECRNRRAHLVYSKDALGITTDFWGELRFKNGYHRKNGDSVPEAMPASFVERLLLTFCPSNSMVIDFFGGAGTVPLICRKLGMKCVSTEILPHRFQIIERRLLENDKKLVRLSKILAEQAASLLAETDMAKKTEPYTKGDKNGQEEGRFQG